MCNILEMGFTWKPFDTVQHFINTPITNQIEISII